jgi:spore germination cell wall hydrolase CwlJ-like protein
VPNLAGASPEVTQRPVAARGEFLRGIALGLVAVSIIALLVAGAPRSHDPAVVLEAMAARGVLLDERIGRLATSMRRSLQCVALAVFMEARGEPDQGQVGVAWVARTRSEERGLTPCAIVFQPAQFSWTSYPVPRIAGAVAADPQSWDAAQDVAWRVLVLNARDPTRTANHFWSGRETPAWARMAAPGSRLRIGGHTFIRIPYRRAPWTAR